MSEIVIEHDNDNEREIERQTEPELDIAELFRKYGSDKDNNGYSHLYSILFDRIRNDNLNVLEIGIGTMIPNVCSSMKNYMPDDYCPGASLRAWRDYFKNSNIYGMDIQQDTQFTDDRIVTYLCDSTNETSVNNVMLDVNVKFDIIIDDGHHYDQSQKMTLVNFLPYLKDGGIYVIEDIYVGSNLTSNGPDEIKNLIGNYEHFFVGLRNNQCVIRKKQINTTRCC
jgi:hypothetical protein